MQAPNKNIKLILNYVIGPAVFCILLYSIYVQIQRQHNWQRSLSSILYALQGRSWWLIAATFVLMFVNWGIEARKWQLALSVGQGVSFGRSLKGIFSGTTMAFFTPNRMGEYMGRMIQLDEGHRLSSIGLTMVGSIAQLMVTLGAGIAGLLHIGTLKGLPQGAGPLWLGLLTYTVLGILIVLTIFYFRFSWLVRSMEKIPVLQKYLAYIRVLDGFNATILLRILSLSAGRYLVFVAQYYLLFRVFKVEIDWWQTFWSVSVVFLVIAIVPSIAVFTELGVRWEASLSVVGLYSPNMTGIFATSLSIWIVNLVMPALIGSMLMAGLKFFRK